MNKKTRNATIFGVAAGIVLVPIIRALINKYRRSHESGEPGSEAPPNHLFAAYRGRFKPHRRKAAHNGQH